MEKNLDIMEVKKQLDEALAKNKRIRVKFRIAKTELFIEIPFERTEMIRDEFGLRKTNWWIFDNSIVKYSMEIDSMENKTESLESYLLSNVVSILNSED